MKRESAADAGEDLATVERGYDVVEAADAGADDLVVAADDHLHAGHALERRRRGQVGKLADILGNDRVDHGRRLALDPGGARKALADAGDDDVTTLRIAGSGIGATPFGGRRGLPTGRASRRARVCPYAYNSAVAVSFKKKRET